jgi:aquaporin Z
MSSLLEEEKEKEQIKNIDLPESVNQNSYSVGQKFCAEFIGTFFLLFVGSGIGVFTNGDLVAVILSNGLVIAAMIYPFGRISGAHFNPSVTIPMFLRQKITIKELAYYLVAQFSGGLVGSLFVFLCNRGRLDNLGSTQIGDFLKEGGELDAWSYIGALLSETILTFGLVMVVFASTVKRNNFNNLTGLIISITLIMLIFTGFYLSGGSMNPVRSIPPAVYEAIIGGNTTAIKQIWIYIIGPIMGGILASLVSLYLN